MKSKDRKMISKPGLIVISLIMAKNEGGLETFHNGYKNIIEVIKAVGNWKG